jgi:hypothetical protein
VVAGVQQHGWALRPRDVGDDFVDMTLGVVPAEGDHGNAQVAEPRLQLFDDARLLDTEIDRVRLPVGAVPAIDGLQPVERRGRARERLVAVNRPTSIHERGKVARAPRASRVPRERLIGVRRVGQELRRHETIEQLPQRDESVVALDDRRGPYRETAGIFPVVLEVS